MSDVDSEEFEDEGPNLGVNRVASILLHAALLILHAPDI